MFFGKITYFFYFKTPCASLNWAHGKKTQKPLTAAPGSERVNVRNTY